jgi:hypothetical protein
MSSVMDEAYHCYVSLEDRAGGGPDREARWQDSAEADNGFGKNLFPPIDMSRSISYIYDIRLMGKRHGN